MKSFFKATPRLARVLSILAFATLISLGEFLVIAPKPALAAGPRVTICHRTKSTTNPYRLITVSNNAVQGGGHGRHTGSVWTSANTNGQVWGDIIPGSDNDGDLFWSDGSGSGSGDNWSGDLTTGGKSFLMTGGANVGKCSRMTAKRFYDISRLAGQTDAQIAEDLNDQDANEDAALGTFTAENIATQVGAVSVTTNTPSVIGTTTATLSGSISAGSTSTTPKFEWGISSTLETFTRVSGGSASTGNISASASLTGLTSGTTYYYRVIGEIGATEETLGTYYGDIVSFTAGKTLRTLTVSAASSSISLGATTSLSTTPSAGSAGTTTYEVVGGLLYCSISGSTLTADSTNAGTCSIRAMDEGDVTYSSAVSPTLEINVTALTTRNLTIDAGSYTSSYAFDVATKPKITSTASAGNSEGTKSFSSSTTPVCTVNSSDGQVAFVDAGTCTLSASIAASGIYASANASSISFTITALDRTLTLTGNLATYAINATPPTMSASTTGGGTISYSSSTTPVCTVNSSSGVVTFVDEGTCSITSSITANSGYAAKNSSARSFEIQADSRTLSINPGSYSATYSGDATPPTITSTASEGSGTKTYSSSTTPVCTVNASSGVVTFVAAGTCTIGATIGVSGRYASATATPISFTISSTPTSSTTSTTVASSPSATARPSSTTTVASTTTTVRENRNVTTTVAANIVNNARRISICHATSSATNPYVLITVDRNSLNGHGDHSGDIIPAPAGGCPSTLISQIATTTTSTPAGRITICHATAAGTYVQITVNKSSLNGHEDHLDDMIPAPSGGCPYSVRQYALQLANTTTSVAPGIGSATTAPRTPAGKITICHATAAGFYVELTVDRNGLNGHDGHDGDILSAPAEGCPRGVSKQSNPKTATTVPDGKISICHATAAGIYVSLTVDRSGLNGHGDHDGDLFVVPSDGCPSRVSALSTRDTMPKLTAGKIGICHARPDKSLKYMEVDQDTFDGHDEHEQDILPAPARGCPSPSSTIDLPLSIACINAREINNLDESNSSLTEGVEVSATKSESESEDDLGSIKLSGSDVGPALTLLSAESVDPEFEIIVKSSGVDYNKPTTWVNEGYGTYCWKLEPFGDRDYIYTLPDPASPPDARYAGLAYSTVIVKAGSITTTDPNYQVNTLFYEPSPGSGVFADVNKNGISDPGGQGGGTLGDKSISHVVVCVGGQSSIAKAPATTLPTSSTVGALQTTTTTINWSADFCPEPSSSTTSIAGGVSEPTSTSSTTTTIAGDSTTSSTTTTIAGGSTSTSTTIAGGSTSTSTTIAGGSTSTSTTIAGGSTSTTTTIAGDSTTSTTASPSTTLVTTTTPPGGSEDPNPPIEIVVRALKASSIGTTDLVLTLSDGVRSEVVFLKLNVKNFSVVETSLPATGQERWSVEQQLGWLLFITGALLGIIEIRRRETLRR